MHTYVHTYIYIYIYINACEVYHPTGASADGKMCGLVIQVKL
jgi:hypothetical protein